MAPEILVLLSALVAAGLFAGFIGGLFGVGGGIVVVPALFYLFGGLGVPEEARAHAAVATSLATIIATSWRSLAAHRKAGAVDLEVLKSWTPWIAAGAALGALVAGLVSGRALLWVFGVAALGIAGQMAFGAANGALGQVLPKGGLRAVLASALGFVSAMIGIGGGAFGVTIMTLYGRPIRQAVATASGFGGAIAVPATIFYIISGWGAPGLPWGSLGYVNAPGFFALALLTAVVAPIGARLAHRLPQKSLQRIFAVFLAVTAVNMLHEAWRG